MAGQSLQDVYFANGECFGCGPKNDKGLQIKSHVEGEELICHWQPQAHHQAYPGMLNGGIIGALLDCHCNWMAAYHLMQLNALDSPPGTVTADYHIRLLQPTPSDQSLLLKAHVLEAKGRKARIHGDLYANDTLCATCEGTFVAVKEDHPAFHRWS